MVCLLKRWSGEIKVESGEIRTLRGLEETRMCTQFPQVRGESQYILGGLELTRQRRNPFDSLLFVGSKEEAGKRAEAGSRGVKNI
jgi:hypothetical protein